MWQMTRDDGMVLAEASTKKAVGEVYTTIKTALDSGTSIWHMEPLFYDNKTGQYHHPRLRSIAPLYIAIELKENRKVEIDKYEPDTCDGGCNGMDEDWYVEFGECDICQKPVVNFMVDYP